MSSDALGYVFRYSPYTGATFAVHLAMGDVVNDAYGYRFFMSVGNLAKKARCERRTAGRALQQLVDDGFLEQLVDHPGGVTEYRFLFPDVALRYGEERPQVASEGVVVMSHPWVLMSHPLGRHNPPSWVLVSQGVGRHDPLTQ